MLHAAVAQALLKGRAQGFETFALSFRDIPLVHQAETQHKHRISNVLHTIELEGIFVQIGLVPNTDWLKGTIELSPRGEIIVDARGETSHLGVFAAGDLTTAPYKQTIISVGEGAAGSVSTRMCSVSRANKPVSGGAQLISSVSILLISPPDTSVEHA